MKRGLHQLSLTAPELAFARDQAITHQNTEHGVGAALLLITRVTVHQHLPRQLRRPDHRGLAQRRRDPVNVSVFLEPFWNPAQRIAPPVVGWPLEPTARRSHAWWK